LYTIPFAQVSNMYAIIQMSGRQARVTPGGIVTVDGTVAEPGARVTLEQVLLVEKDGGEVLAGAPYVADARVVGVVEGDLTPFPEKSLWHIKMDRAAHATVATRTRSASA
jgi:ribosomal protein L21